MKRYKMQDYLQEKYSQYGFPKINILYLGNRATVTYCMTKEDKPRGHIDVYYGFAFVTRLKKAVNDVNKQLKKRVEEEWENIYSAKHS